MIFTNIEDAIEECIFRRYHTGVQKRHYGVVQLNGYQMAVRIVRNSKPFNFMWTTKSCVSH